MPLHCDQFNDWTCREYHAVVWIASEKEFHIFYDFASYKRDINLLVLNRLVFFAETKDLNTGQIMVKLKMEMASSSTSKFLLASYIFKFKQNHPCKFEFQP